ncbi:MAG: MFS transporter, partial [Candidatus Tisiphia sp.]
MLKYQQEQRILTREQKEAVGLLSIGTFLEYFDLMLYVHMAVLLNELFFPKYDPFTTSLLTALAFCSTFVFRPFGALLFGWIGDTIGRKATVIITTFMMAFSCLIMANLPTYEQIGVTAAWLVTICRIVQGISSMGEIIGSQIYLTEMTKPPIQYPVVALIVTLSVLGGVTALGTASLVTSHGFNWRMAFWIGAIIAVIGIVARTALRETPEFADAKRQLKKSLAPAFDHIDEKKLESNIIWKEKVKHKTSLAYFLIECVWPVSFYFTYLHCSNVLKNSFGYTTEQVIHNSFIVSIVNLLSYIILTYLSYKIYPLVIIKIRLVIFWGFAFVCPYLLSNVSDPFEVLLIQSFFIVFRPDAFPAIPIYIKHFPVFKRFTYPSWLFALSRALMHIITSFGFIYLVNYFGHWGILIILIPVSIGFTFGVSHFEKLDKEAGNYPQKSCSVHM